MDYEYIAVDESDKDFWNKARKSKFVPKGRIPVGHISGNPAMVWDTAESRNLRLIMRMSAPDGQVCVWRIRKSKSVRQQKYSRGLERQGLHYWRMGRNG